MLDWFAKVGTFITAIAAAVGILAWPAKQLVSGLLKRELKRFELNLKHKHDEALAKFKENLQHEHELELARYTSELVAKSKSDERIVHEIIAWANPIQDAAKSLQGRLKNILKQEGYKALHPGYSTPDWRITYEYFSRSTAYVFGQYFCWINMLRLEMSFELFRTQADKVAFFEKINAVSKALGDYDPPIYSGTGHDSQIFRIQQQAMGELLSTRRAGRRACRGPAYFDSKQSDPVYQAAFRPAYELIDKLQPGEKRYKRLEFTLAAVDDLVKHCDELLKLAHA